MSTADTSRNDFGEHVLHVGAGFKEKERPHILETLESLGRHLGRWDPRDMVVEVSVQDRDGKDQHVTLRTSLPGRVPLVAIAANADITHALTDAKRELIRQIDHQREAGEAMNNNRLKRQTIRHPYPSSPAEVPRFAADPIPPDAEGNGQPEARS
jgi:ribosome-associated translation inhibitor RaiA